MFKIDKNEIKDEIEIKVIKFGITAVVTIIATLLTAIFFKGGELKLYKQNETVKYKDVEYSIVKVEKNQSKIYEDYNDLKVTFKITNKSKSTAKYSSFDYYITNKNNENVGRGSIVEDDGTFLDSGDLEPGESVVGAISFCIKKDATDLRVRYSEELLKTVDKFDFQWALDN